MKKIIHGLLGAMLLVSGLNAADKSNRTWISARDSISDNALMNASVPAANCNKKGMVGADISVTGYYRRSHNNTELAKYFGAGDGTAAKPVSGSIKVGGDTKNATATGYHIYGAALERTPGATPLAGGDTDHAMGGEAKFDPVREEYGMNLALSQDLGRFVDGLSLSVSAPVVGVRTHMGLDVVNPTASQAKTTDGGNGKNLSDYFSGTSLGKKATGGAAQKDLTHAKIMWKKAQDSKFGIANVSVDLNWKFLQESDYCVSAGLSALLPTGNDVDGKLLFEPAIGSKHFGLGGSLSSSFSLWRSADKKDSLDFNVGARYHYLFGADRTRILGVWNHVDSKLVDAGHYRVTFRPGTGVSAVPAANELVSTVNVTPGSQVDASAGVCYRWSRWNFDASYNLHYAEAETVKLKNATGWADNMVGYAGYKANSTGTIIVGKSPAGVAADNTDYWNADYHTLGGPIQQDGTVTGTDSNGGVLAGLNTARYHVTTKACATPSQLTHKVGGSFGYQFNTAKPVRVGMGGEYEVGSNNDSVASWAIWAKVGFCF